MATIAPFMPAREEAGIMRFPHPRELDSWDTRNPEPSYDKIYVVQIDDANPARFRVAVRTLPIGAVGRQTDLDQSHLKLAEEIIYHDRDANSGRNLDLKFKSKNGALVIFHLTDSNASFADNVLNSVVRNADERDQILFNAHWVTGNEIDRKAVSVIMIGGAAGTKKLDYGLGVRLRNDDPKGQGYTNIIIDPKVENEGTR